MISECCAAPGIPVAFRRVPALSGVTGNPTVTPLEINSSVNILVGEQSIRKLFKLLKPNQIKSLGAVENQGKSVD
jgi:hypothetical protein